MTAVQFLIHHYVHLNLPVMQNGLYTIPKGFILKEKF